MIRLLSKYLYFIILTRRLRFTDAICESGELAEANVIFKKDIDTIYHFSFGYDFITKFCVFCISEQDESGNFDEQGHSSSGRVSQSQDGDEELTTRDMLVESPFSTGTNSRPVSSCGTPTPVTPNISPANTASTRDASSASPNMSSDSLPKLRLNTSLASDPALQPAAKHIKCIRPSTTDKYNNQTSCDEDGDDVHMTDEQPPSPRLRDDGKSSGRNQREDRMDTSTAGAAVVDAMPRMAAFICAPCGIKFSSLSTLEAHQTYYCSHK